MFNIGDKLTKENYTEGAIWCSENNATIELIEGEYVIVAIPEPTEEEKAQARIAELKRQLSDTDYVALKIAEGSATTEEYADVIAQRKAWRAEINELEKTI